MRERQVACTVGISKIYLIVQFIQTGAKKLHAHTLEVKHKYILTNGKVRLERFVYILVYYEWPRKFKFLNVGKYYQPVNFG